MNFIPNDIYPPYNLSFEAELRRLGLASESELAELGCMDLSRRMEVLRYFAELTFACQNVANITLGRAALAQVPYEILTGHWTEMPLPHLASNDDWEYRRIADLLPQHLQLCAGHPDSCIREIATEGTRFQVLPPP